MAVFVRLNQGGFYEKSVNGGNHPDKGWGTWVRNHRFMIAGGTLLVIFGGFALYKKYQLDFNVGHRRQETNVGGLFGKIDSRKDNSINANHSFNNSKNSNVNVDIGHKGAERKGPGWG